ncbi:putative bifunctional diguanylate cyclase/phosphodiesterase [Catenovulum sediminis]|uniref:putative bifunctional diguanylate cyclase/phosphodiesterase n=1 Tax=Catenovulum sediminis TaxID=1740262 RepID=UPI00118026D3|nr:GGDEF domain-containing phosphodiesterase [Catenovulum sediminis]
MKSQIKQLRNKANIVLILSITAVFLFSGYAYLTINQLQNTANPLLEEHTPALVQSRKVSVLLSEQESLLYKYYVTLQTRLFTQDYQTRRSELEKAMAALATNYAQKNIINALQSQLSAMESGAVKLDKTLSLQVVDWDLAREQLAQISQYRKNALVILNAFETTVNDLNTKRDKNISSLFGKMLIPVSVYSALILLLILAFRKYLQKSLELSATNERLAMFASRNPNPVLSVDSQGDIRYANPSTYRMLREIGLVDKPILMLADNLTEQLALVKNKQSSETWFKHQINGYFLSYQIHWLADLDAFDIQINNITAQKKYELQMHFKAHHHDSTGLYNASKFNEDLAATIQHSQHFWLMLIELPDYGKVSENHGLSGATDYVLNVAKSLSKVFEDAKRELLLQSNIYHIADANFTIIFNTERQHSNILERVSNAISKRFEQNIATQQGLMQVALKIGVSEFPQCGQSVETLLLQAKLALDAANESEQIAKCFDKDLGFKHARRLDITRKLIYALEYRQFELYFQPQYAIHHKKMTGVETLVRWCVDGAFISPSEFIPIAEQNGLILPLGSWILKSACQQAANWQNNLPQNAKIAVNISARQFLQPGFCDEVERALHDSGLAPERLALEITEGVITQNKDQGIKVLQKLKSIGIGVAIDDFGTGFSSLAYLKQVPIDKLKVDLSFIRNMQSNKDDQAIVITVCQLAKNLNLTVIAEGVESKEQLKMLETFGCDEIQGYWYSKPLSQADFEAFVHAAQYSLD